MPTTSTIQAVPLPTTTDNPAIPADMATHVAFMEKRLVMRFDSTTERDATITVPEAGMVAYLTGSKTFTFHDGSNWLNLISQVQSLNVAPVDSLNSGGQVTLVGAGANKSWGVKSQAGTLVFRYDMNGTPSDVLTLAQTSVSIPTGVTFNRSGVAQPVLRSGSGAPNNGVGVDGDWYARF